MCVCMQGTLPCGARTVWQWGVVVDVDEHPTVVLQGGTKLTTFPERFGGGTLLAAEPRDCSLRLVLSNEASAHSRWDNNTHTHVEEPDVEAHFWKLTHPAFGGSVHRTARSARAPSVRQT